MTLTSTYSSRLEALARAIESTPKGDDVVSRAKEIEAFLLGTPEPEPQVEPRFYVAPCPCNTGAPHTTVLDREAPETAGDYFATYDQARVAADRMNAEARS